MICHKCKQPIENMTVYKHLPGIGDVHVECPADPQQSLIEEERLDVDADAQYPD